MFNDMAYWQKGALGGVVMTVMILGLLFLIIMGNNAMIDAKGLPVVCSDGALCSFVEASGSYGKAFMALAMVAGLFAGILGAVIGILLDKTRIKY